MNPSALFNISYGLYVLTASEGDKDNGCIINTLMQQTSSPMRISVTVNKANLTCDMIRRTGIFNVSVIDNTADFELFRHFGFRSGSSEEKFGTTESHRYKPCYSDNGVLYLNAYCNAFISGKVISETDLGTHIMFTAEVTDGEILSDKPSMTYAKYHADVKPKAKPQKKQGWVCRICGYVYEGSELPADFECPLCKHGAEDFDPIN